MSMTNFIPKGYDHILTSLLILVTGGRKIEFTYIKGAQSWLEEKIKKPEQVQCVQGVVQGSSYSFDPKKDYRILFDESSQDKGNTNSPQNSKVDSKDGVKPSNNTKPYIAWSNPPDNGSQVHVFYRDLDDKGALCPNDVQIGSVMRTLCESFSFGLGQFYKQLEFLLKSSYLDTAEGNALDRIASMFSIQRGNLEDDDLLRKRCRDHLAGSGKCTSIAIEQELITEDSKTESLIITSENWVDYKTKAPDIQKTFDTTNASYVVPIGEDVSSRQNIPAGHILATIYNPEMHNRMYPPTEISTQTPQEKIQEIQKKLRERLHLSKAAGIVSHIKWADEVLFDYVVTLNLHKDGELSYFQVCASDELESIQTEIEQRVQLTVTNFFDKLHLGTYPPFDTLERLISVCHPNICYNKQEDMCTYTSKKETRHSLYFYEKAILQKCTVVRYTVLIIYLQLSSKQMAYNEKAQGFYNYFGKSPMIFSKELFSALTAAQEKKDTTWTIGKFCTDNRQNAEIIKVEVHQEKAMTVEQNKKSPNSTPTTPQDLSEVPATKLPNAKRMNIQIRLSPPPKES